METVLLDSELERSAFALFTREHSQEFRRVLCYLVAKNCDKAHLVQSISYRLNRRYQYTNEDVLCAMNVLKSVFAFDSFNIWTRGGDNKHLCQYKKSECAEAWLKEIEQEYPHVLRMLTPPYKK